MKGGEGIGPRKGDLGQVKVRTHVGENVEIVYEPLNQSALKLNHM